MIDRAHDDQPGAAATWQRRLQAYCVHDPARATWLVVSSLVPWAATWYLAYRSLALPYGVTLALAVVLAGLQVRIFTVQHDCGHGSFSRHRWIADGLGVLCSLITIVPYHEWKRHHLLHHATSGNLERRGHGDVWTMTVAEYGAASPWLRLQYRLFRHPFVMFGVGPPLLFVLARRWPTETPRSWKLERGWVYATNVLIAGALVLAGSILSWRPFLSVYIPTTLVMSIMGCWLFYIQHQFPHTYWAHDEKWSWRTAAFQGSSYYVLPAVLRWFVNNVNIHHVHHIAPRIPSYHLQRCHDETPEFAVVPRIHIGQAMRTIGLSLWSESQQRLVSFRAARAELAGQGTR